MALVDALGAENARWVGGAVRDSLLGIEVQDVDCATRLLPEEVMRACEEAGIRTVPTGIDHGTVTAILKQGEETHTVEVTTLRRDVATDGRRATIAFASDWREDAARRDFTINALYAHPHSLAISDYFGGLADLEAGCVRFIGEAAERIAEDHLRILRYYRFQARFGARLDPAAEEACAQLAPMLKGLSRERVAGELLKLLALPDPGATVRRMFERGVLGVILPETCRAHVAGLERLIAAERAEHVPPSALRRLAALLPPSSDVAETLAARLRLSKNQRARLVSAADRREGDADNPRALAYRLSRDYAIDRLLLLGAPIAPIRDWDPPEFPLKGGAIVARGIAAGPDVARILKEIERRWIAEGFPPAPRIDALLSQIIAQD